jgi:hypothetical protein
MCSVPLGNSVELLAKLPIIVRVKKKENKAYVLITFKLKIENSGRIKREDYEALNSILSAQLGFE